MGRTTGTPLHEAHATYVEQRGRATSTSTRRLRWQLRRLPKHFGDQTTIVRRKAIRDELHLRGVEVPHVRLR